MHGFIRCGDRSWKIRKRKNMLIKDNITRNIHTICWNVKAFITFVQRTVPKEDTFFRTKLKLTIIVRTEMRPTRTTEDFEKSVVRSLMKQEFKRSFHAKKPRRKSIYKKTGGSKSITPKTKRNRSMS